MVVLLRLNEIADNVACGISGGTRMQLVSTSTGQWMTWRAAWTDSLPTVRRPSCFCTVMRGNPGVTDLSCCHGTS